MLVPKIVIRLIMFWLAYRCLLNDVDGFVFTKVLKHKNYPGKCFPVPYMIDQNEKYLITALSPGEEMQDPDLCGVMVCNNADGELTHYYCVAPTIGSECPGKGCVSRDGTFPDCCWNCFKCGTCRAPLGYPYPPPRDDSIITG